MTSIIRNAERGSWIVQWHDGSRWVRKTLVGRKRGWKPGDPMAAKPPAEAVEALVAFQRKEDAARINRGGDAVGRIEKFLADYQTGHAERREPNSSRNLACAVKAFLAFCKASKSVYLEKVTPGLADRFLTVPCALLEPFDDPHVQGVSCGRLESSGQAPRTQGEPLDRP